MRDVVAPDAQSAGPVCGARRKTHAARRGTAFGTALAASPVEPMIADAMLAGTITPTLRRERLLVAATLALLVTCVFDVGRVLYYRMVLNYAVAHSARVLARSEGSAAASAARATELVRVLSGVTDVLASSVRVARLSATSTGGSAGPCTTRASAVVVSATYAVPLVSPPLWPIFGGGRVALDVAAGAQSAS